MKGGQRMKYFLIFVTLMCLVLFGGNVARTGDEPARSKPKPTVNAEISKKPARVYPIAPGVWYPQYGPIPERPIRYYRIRCWPGCHRGSPYGKYPNKPLNMKPIFPTSTVQGQPPVQKEVK